MVNRGTWHISGNNMLKFYCNSRYIIVVLINYDYTFSVITHNKRFVCKVQFLLMCFLTYKSMGSSILLIYYYCGRF